MTDNPFLLMITGGFQGQCLFDQGLFMEALEALNKAAEMKPSCRTYKVRRSGSLCAKIKIVVLLFSPNIYKNQHASHSSSTTFWIVSPSLACLSAVGQHSDCLKLVNSWMLTDGPTSDLYVLRARLHKLLNQVTTTGNLLHFKHLEAESVTLLKPAYLCFPTYLDFTMLSGCKVSVSAGASIFSSASPAAAAAGSQWTGPAKGSEQIFDRSAVWSPVYDQYRFGKLATERSPLPVQVNFTNIRHSHRQQVRHGWSIGGPISTETSLILLCLQSHRLHQF